MSELICPCCRQPMAAPPPMAGVLDGLRRPQHRVIAEALIKAYPRPLSRDRLIELLYGDDPDGGPEGAGNIVTVRIAHLRKELAPMGWTVNCNGRGRGYVGSYRLEPVERK